MAITLEQIEEMKIPVGAPIELVVNLFNGPGYTRKPALKLTYFGGVVRDEFRIMRDPKKTQYQYYNLDKVEQVRVLEYRD